VCVIVAALDINPGAAVVQKAAISIAAAVVSETCPLALPGCGTDAVPWVGCRAVYPRPLEAQFLIGAGGWSAPCQHHVVGTGVRPDRWLPDGI